MRESRCLSVYCCNYDHAESHSDGAYNEKEFSAVSIDRPCSIEGEEDGECGVHSINQENGVGAGENLLVNDGAVGVQGSLPGELLSGVQGEGDE